MSLEELNKFINCIMNHPGCSCLKLDRSSRNAIIERDCWSISESLKFWAFELILLNSAHFYSASADLKIYLINNSPMID